MTQEQTVRIPKGDEPDIERKGTTPVTVTTSNTSELKRATFRAYNVAEEARSLTLTTLDQTHSVGLLDEHQLDPRTGIRIVASLPSGEYRLEARLDTDETATRRVEIAPEANRKWVTYVTPNETLLVRKWPGDTDLR